MNPPVFDGADDLEAFLRSLGNSPSDEEGLTELEHLLQCADILRAVAPDDPELQVAGLLHDIGFTPDRESEHGLIGTMAVKGLVGERLAELIRLHVDAKRYLVACDASYRDRLSPVSVETLGLQGGGMDAVEVAAFEANPFFKDAIRLRRADDLAKVPGKPTASLSDWLPTMRALIAARRP